MTEARFLVYTRDDCPLCDEFIAELSRLPLHYELRDVDAAIKRGDPDCAYVYARWAIRKAIEELASRFRCTFCRVETEIVYFVDHKPACRWCKIGLTGNDNLR